MLRPCVIRFVFFSSPLLFISLLAILKITFHFQCDRRVVECLFPYHYWHSHSIDKKFDVAYTMTDFVKSYNLLQQTCTIVIVTWVGPGTNQLPPLLLTHFPLFELLFNMEKEWHKPIIPCNKIQIEYTPTDDWPLTIFECLRDRNQVIRVIWKLLLSSSRYLNCSLFALFFCNGCNVPFMFIVPKRADKWSRI